MSEKWSFIIVDSFLKAVGYQINIYSDIELNTETKAETVISSKTELFQTPTSIVVEKCILDDGSVYNGCILNGRPNGRGKKNIRKAVYMKVIG